MQSHKVHGRFEYRKRNESCFPAFPYPPQKNKTKQNKTKTKKPGWTLMYRNVAIKHAPHEQHKTGSLCSRRKVSVLHVQLNVHAQCHAQVQSNTLVQPYVENNRESYFSWSLLFVSLFVFLKMPKGKMLSGNNLSTPIQVKSSFTPLESSRYHIWTHFPTSSQGYGTPIGSWYKIRYIWCLKKAGLAS